MTEIPKLLHLTSKDGKLKAIPRKCMTRLRDLHPGWPICIYNDDEARRVIQRNLPELLGVYDSYPMTIQRTDMFRVVIVYLYGGFYLDTDLYCLKPFDSLRKFGLVLGEEIYLSDEQCAKLGHQYPLRVANYMFAGVPRHPFLLGFLQEMVRRSRQVIRKEDDILESTGPGLLTNFYHDNRDNYPDIVLLPNKDRTCLNKWCKAVSCHFGDYGAHLHIGSWRWSRKKSIFRKIEKPPDDPNRLIILETYDLRTAAFDGLTTVLSRVTNIGEVMADSSKVKGAKVLTCGLPFLYEKRISRANINFIYTTFESDRLPPFWVRSINKYYNYCIVPHEEIRTVFLNSGVKIPVFIVHQGFHRFKRGFRRHSSIEPFTVGFLGVPVNRKNLLKLYAACRLLKKSEIPELRLAIHAASKYEFLDMKRFGEMKDDPFVIWTSGRYDNDQIADWYHSISCYVYPSSGEGWSFTPRESLYLGVPTVLSDIPVHKELVESGFCRTIQSRDKERANFDGCYFGQWATITEDEIAAAILAVYKNYPYYSTQAQKGAEWIEGKWENEGMRQELLNLITSL